MPRSKQEGARKPEGQQKANFSDCRVLGTVLSILHRLHHLILTAAHNERSAIIILILRLREVKLYSRLHS